VTRPLNDLVPVPEADHRACVTLLVPERSNLVLELLMLSGQSGVVSAREAVQNVSPTFGKPVDVLSDFGECAHVFKNEPRCAPIPER
jgi:hypothetical protein